MFAQVQELRRRPTEERLYDPEAAAPAVSMVATLLEHARAVDRGRLGQQQTEGCFNASALACAVEATVRACAELTGRNNGRYPLRDETRNDAAHAVRRRVHERVGQGAVAVLRLLHDYASERAAASRQRGTGGAEWSLSSVQASRMWGMPGWYRMDNTSLHSTMLFEHKSSIAGVPLCALPHTFAEEVRRRSPPLN